MVALVGVGEWGVVLWRWLRSASKQVGLSFAISAVDCEESGGVGSWLRLLIVLLASYRLRPKRCA